MVVAFCRLIDGYEIFFFFFFINMIWDLSNPFKCNFIDLFVELRKFGCTTSQNCQQLQSLRHKFESKKVRIFRLRVFWVCFCNKGLIFNGFIEIFIFEKCNDVGTSTFLEWAFKASVYNYYIYWLMFCQLWSFIYIKYKNNLIFALTKWPTLKAPFTF